MVRRPPGSTRTARRLPDTPLFRSILGRGRAGEAVLAVHVHRTAAADALAARAAESQRRILLALHLDERVEHHRAAFFGVDLERVELRVLPLFGIVAIAFEFLEGGRALGLVDRARLLRGAVLGPGHLGPIAGR